MQGVPPHPGPKGRALGATALPSAWLETSQGAGPAAGQRDGASLRRARSSQGGHPSPVPTTKSQGTGVQGSSLVWLWGCAQPQLAPPPISANGDSPVPSHLPGSRAACLAVNEAAWDAEPPPAGLSPAPVGIKHQHNLREQDRLGWAGKRQL